MKRYDIIQEVAKFNPHHGPDGRFSSADGAASFTFRTKDPKKQHWADMAIARAKDKNKATAAAAPKEPEQTGPKGLGSQNTKGHSKVKLEDYDDKVSYVKNQLAVGVDTAERWTGAIEAFTGSDSSEIRAAQTGKTPDDFYEETGNALEEYIARAPKWGNKGPLYRGLHLDNDSLNTVLEKAKNGELLDNRGTSSWSSTKGIAQKFAGSGQMSTPVILVNRTGTKCGTSVKHLSEYDHEDEVMMSKEQRTRATKITKTKINGATGYIIEVEEVAP